MEHYFTKPNFQTKKIKINLEKYWTVDQLCASVLAKIYLSLKCDTKVAINSKYFKGSDLFILTNQELTKNDCIISFSSTRKVIKVNNQGKHQEFPISEKTFSEYFYKLIIKYNYVIDYEIVGFYTLVALKTSLFDENIEQRKKAYLKLLKIMNEEQFYTLEYNVDQIIEKIDNYVI